MRCFFALLPDAPARQALARLQARLPLPATARPVSPENLHLTLAFVGACDEARVTCLRKQAGTVVFSAFPVQLDTVGAFGGARVWWAGPGEPAPELLGLAERLGSALAGCGYRPETRGFNPHVTLARDARDPIPASTAFSPVEWRADAFCLMSSRTGDAGAYYEVIERFPAGH